VNVYPIKCQIRAQGDVTRVDVYDDIGGGGWLDEGLTAKSFAAQLAGVKGGLEVHINSGGGNVFDGIAIGNAIRGHKGPVTTVVDGVAASIASVIAQAGQDRVVEPGSMMMIHDAFGMCMGDAAEMAKMAATLDDVSDNIAGIYAERAGGDAGEWRTVMKDETWYKADGAVAAGLADRVGQGTAALPAGLDLAAYALPGRIAAALRSLPRAAAPAHAPFDGKHSHGHADPGDGGDHTHSHVHDSDADHGHHTATDPDGDGDDDSTPEGDTDHDYWTADGKPKKPLTGAMPEQQIRAIVRDELAAQSHLPDGNDDDGHTDAGLAWSGPDQFKAALERKVK
jgi:ATP-dependent protease ClpP protease subunit